MHSIQYINKLMNKILVYTENDGNKYGHEQSETLKRNQNRHLLRRKLEEERIYTVVHIINIKIKINDLNDVYVKIMHFVFNNLQNTFGTRIMGQKEDGSEEISILSINNIDFCLSSTLR